MGREKSRVFSQLDRLTRKKPLILQAGNLIREQVEGILTKLSLQGSLLGTHVQEMRGKLLYVSWIAKTYLEHIMAYFRCQFGSLSAS